MLMLCCRLGRRFELIPQWYNYLDPKPGFLPEGQTAYGMKMFNDGGGGEAGAPKVSTAQGGISHCSMAESYASFPAATSAADHVAGAKTAQYATNAATLPRSDHVGVRRSHRIRIAVSYCQ